MDLADVSIYSIQGQLVYQSNEVSDVINVRNFAPGTYTLRAKGIDGKQYYARFVVR